MKKALAYTLSLVLLLVSLTACHKPQDSQQDTSQPGPAATSSQADVSTPEPEPEPPATPAPEPVADKTPAAPPETEDIQAQEEPAAQEPAEPEPTSKPVTQQQQTQQNQQQSHQAKPQGGSQQQGSSVNQGTPGYNPYENLDLTEISKDTRTEEQKRQDEEMNREASEGTIGEITAGGLG